MLDGSCIFTSETEIISNERTDTRIDLRKQYLSTTEHLAGHEYCISVTHSTWVTETCALFHNFPLIIPPAYEVCRGVYRRRLSIRSPIRVCVRPSIQVLTLCVNVLRDALFCLLLFLTAHTLCY